MFGNLNKFRGPPWYCIRKVSETMSTREEKIFYTIQEINQVPILLNKSLSYSLATIMHKFPEPYKLTAK